MLLFAGLKTKFEVEQLGQDRFTERNGGRRHKTAGPKTQNSPHL